MGKIVQKVTSSGQVMYLRRTVEIHQDWVPYRDDATEMLERTANRLAAHHHQNTEAFGSKVQAVPA